MSSQQWIKRQLADKWSERARAEGWRSRAAFKLLEIDDRFRLIKKGSRVIDLGAAPGGWIQVALDRGASAVAGVDLLMIEPIPGATLIQADFTHPGVDQQLIDAIGGRPDLVLSDMALQHGRPSQDGPPEDHRPDRDRRRLRHPHAEAGREFRLQELPGGRRRRGSDAAARGVRDGEVCKAGIEPKGQRRGVSGGAEQAVGEETRSILHRETGEGDRRRRWRGRRRPQPVQIGGLFAVGSQPACLISPPPPCCAWSPPRCAGEDGVKRPLPPPDGPFSPRCASRCGRAG